MEMNTRLQVEHPVTELVTGLDLVEWQLRVARGEALPLAQDEIALNGHAIEVRLCAEEPADDFLPRTGEILAWRPAASVRCDHALADGLGVSPYYNSMLGKLIAHGATRAEALAKLAHALDETVLLGVPTNRAFLARVLRHPAFADGRDVSTAFIERFFPDNASRAQQIDDAVWTLAAWLSVAAAPDASPWTAEWRAWTSGLPLAQPWRLERVDDGEERKGYIEVERDGARLLGEGVSNRIDAQAAPPNERATARVGDVDVGYSFAWNGDRLWLHVGGQDFAFADRRRQSAAKEAAEIGVRRDTARPHERPCRQGARRRHDGCGRRRRAHPRGHEDGARHSRPARRHLERGRRQGRRPGDAGAGAGADRRGLGRQPHPSHDLVSHARDGEGHRRHLRHGLARRRERPPPGRRPTASRVHCRIFLPQNGHAATAHGVCLLMC